eukprot:scaffold68896_cov20-Tisochrysis_lutea.AAC.1
MAVQGVGRVSSAPGAHGQCEISWYTFLQDCDIPVTLSETSCQHQESTGARNACKAAAQGALCFNFAEHVRARARAGCVVQAACCVGLDQRVSACRAADQLQALHNFAWGPGCQVLQSGDLGCSSLCVYVCMCDIKLVSIVAWILDQNPTGRGTNKKEGKDTALREEAHTARTGETNSSWLCSGNMIAAEGGKRDARGHAHTHTHTQQQQQQQQQPCGAYGTGWTSEGSTHILVYTHARARTYTNTRSHTSGHAFGGRREDLRNQITPLGWQA